MQRKNWASPLFVGVGIVLLLLSIGLSFSGSVLSFDKKVLENESFTSQIDYSSKPSAIKIPKVEIDLPIVETVITDGTWEISKHSASHLANSANPGSGGNIVVYGHNKNSLFGPIRWLEVGDEIILFNADGEEFRYRIVESFITNPKNIDSVLPTNDERLTIYTCTGFLDKDRHIVVAKPVSN